MKKKLILVTFIFILFIRFEAKTPLLTSNYYIDKNLSDSEKIIDQLKKNNLRNDVYQLFTHGRFGELFIENHWMNKEEIALFLQKKLSKKITHINIYGCQFAKGKKGLEAVKYLEKKLSVSIAASTNITGRGGDWYLEISSNTIESLSIPAYRGTLQDVCMEKKLTALSSWGTPSPSGDNPKSTSPSGCNNNMGGTNHGTGTNGGFATEYDAPAGVTWSRAISGLDPTKTYNVSVNMFKCCNAGDKRNMFFNFNLAGRTGSQTFFGNTNDNNQLMFNFDVTNKTSLNFSGTMQAAAWSGCEQAIGFMLFINVSEVALVPKAIIPALSTKSGEISCGSLFNLNTLVTGTTPSGTNLVWYTNNTHSGTAYSTPAEATAGDYFAYYLDSTNNCFGPVSEKVTITDTTPLVDTDKDGIPDKCDDKNDNEDFDKDGVPDHADIDDDNDGVLDTTEAGTCTSLSLGADGSFEKAATVAWNEKTNTASLNSNMGTTGWASINSPDTWTGSFSLTGEGYWAGANNGVPATPDGNVFCSIFAGFTNEGIQTTIPSSSGIIKGESYVFKYYQIFGGVNGVGFTKIDQKAQFRFTIDGVVHLGSMLNYNGNNPKQWTEDQFTWVATSNNPVIKIETLPISGVDNLYLGIDGIKLYKTNTVGCDVPIDTDKDGIPNHFDLDSDGDGCPDFKESGATGTFQNGNVINNIPNTTANIANAVAVGPYGVNGLANQLENNDTKAATITYTSTYIQNALSATVNSCVCCKPGLTTGTPMSSITGISDFSGLASDSRHWVNNMPENGALVMGSHTKGFVITRIASPEKVIIGADAIKGMLVFDTVANCLKMYDGTEWFCLTQKCVDN